MGCDEGAEAPAAETPVISADLLDLNAECLSGCRERVEAVVAACRDAGRGPVACRAAAEDAAHHCRVACGRELEPRPEARRPAPPPDARPADRCEASCEARGQFAARQCVQEGGAPERCRQRGGELTRACIEDHCAAPAEPPCEARCAEGARDYLAMCIEEHGEENADACALRARHTLAVCVEDQCGGGVEPPAPPPADCAEACGAEGRAFNRECVAQNGDAAAERCRAAAAARVEACIADRCEAPPPPPPAGACEDRCNAAARAFNQECVASGASAERCGAAAQQQAATCIEQHCAAVSRPAAARRMPARIAATLRRGRSTRSAWRAVRRRSAVARRPSSRRRPASSSTARPWSRPASGGCVRRSLRRGGGRRARPVRRGRQRRGGLRRAGGRLR
ncbi:MAG: hypothetical protein R3F43_09695 [bacterium]